MTLSHTATGPVAPASMRTDLSWSNGRIWVEAPLTHAAHRPMAAPCSPELERKKVDQLPQEKCCTTRSCACQPMTHACPPFDFGLVANRRGCAFRPGRTADSLEHACALRQRFQRTCPHRVVCAAGSARARARMHAHAHECNKFCSCTSLPLTRTGSQHARCTRAQHQLQRRTGAAGPLLRLLRARSRPATNLRRATTAPARWNAGPTPPGAARRSAWGRAGARARTCSAQTVVGDAHVARPPPRLRKQARSSAL